MVGSAPSSMRMFRTRLILRSIGCKLMAAKVQLRDATSAELAASNLFRAPEPGAKAGEMARRPGERYALLKRFPLLCVRGALAKDENHRVIRRHDLDAPCRLPATRPSPVKRSARPQEALAGPDSHVDRRSALDDRPLQVSWNARHSFKLSNYRNHLGIGKKEGASY